MNDPRTPARPRVSVVTTGRADYGIYRPLLAAMQREAYSVVLLVGGTHPVERFGRTLDRIRADGWGRVRVVNHYIEADHSVALAYSCGRAIGGFAEVIADEQPDVVVVLGDRYEMLAAGFAAVLCKAPLAHLHGGDVTEGAYDDQFRHALTKLSHLHFPALAEHGARIRAMGEEPWRVHVVGGLALDALQGFEPEPLEVIAREACLDPSFPTIVVVYHPETLDRASGASAFEKIAVGLSGFEGNVLLMGTNADEGHMSLAATMWQWTKQRPRTVMVASLEQRRFWSWLSHAAALVGNSSSGVIEAPSVRVPVVNIGDRQKGRVRCGNVIDVPCDASAIAAGLTQALSESFRKSLADIVNPYGDGHAAGRIVRVLAELPARETLLRKRWSMDAHVC